MSNQEIEGEWKIENREKIAENVQKFKKKTTKNVKKRSKMSKNIRKCPKTSYLV